MREKRTIYFLEWLENYGIEQNEFLTNCYPENRQLDSEPSFETYILNKHHWITKAFLWKRSQCVEHLGLTLELEKYEFFLKLERHWDDILGAYPIEDIKFSRYKINDFKVIEDEFKLHFA